MSNIIVTTITGMLGLKDHMYNGFWVVRYPDTVGSAV